jgi:hypothetical protein
MRWPAGKVPAADPAVRSADAAAVSASVLRGRRRSDARRQRRDRNP